MTEQIRIEVRKKDDYIKELQDKIITATDKAEKLQAQASKIFSRWEEQTKQQQEVQKQFDLLRNYIDKGFADDVKKNLMQELNKKFTLTPKNL